MNQCDDRMKELLPLYVDSELTSEEKALVEAHILVCSDCKSELQLFQEIHDELNLEAMSAPQGFHEDLVSKLDALPKKSKKSLYKSYNKYVNVAAMLILVIFLSAIGLTKGHPWETTSDEAIVAESDETMGMARGTNIAEDTDETKDSRETMKSDDTMETASIMMEDIMENVDEEMDNSQELAMFGDSGDTAYKEVDENAQEEVAEEEAFVEGSAETVVEEALLADEFTTEEDVSSDDAKSADILVSGANVDETDVFALEMTEDKAVPSDNTLNDSYTFGSENPKNPTVDLETKETIQTTSASHEPSSNIVGRILIIAVSLIGLGSLYYLIRKRKFKN